MIIYQCRLPFPPSVNGLYGGGSGQQRFMTKKYKAWVAACPLLDTKAIKDPVSIEYVFTWPCKRLRDGGNYLKAPLDYLVKQAVILDDNYTIVVSESWRHIGVKKECPGVEVIIRSVE